LTNTAGGSALLFTAGATTNAATGIFEKFTEAAVPEMVKKTGLKLAGASCYGMIPLVGGVALYNLTASALNTKYAQEQLPEVVTSSKAARRAIAGTAGVIALVALASLRR
jgi:hypothetical protein